MARRYVILTASVDLQELVLNNPLLRDELQRGLSEMYPIASGAELVLEFSPMVGSRASSYLELAQGIVRRAGYDVTFTLTKNCL